MRARQPRRMPDAEAGRPQHRERTSTSPKASARKLNPRAEPRARAKAPSVKNCLDRNRPRSKNCLDRNPRVGQPSLATEPTHEWALGQARGPRTGASPAHRPGRARAKSGHRAQLLTGPRRCTKPPNCGLPPSGPTEPAGRVHPRMGTRPGPKPQNGAGAQHLTDGQMRSQIGPQGPIIKRPTPQSTQRS